MQYNQHLGRTLLFPINGASDAGDANDTVQQPPESVKPNRKNRREL